MKKSDLIEEKESLSEAAKQPLRQPVFWLMVLYIFLLAAGMFITRQIAPPNLMANDQEKVAAYVLDALGNGEWIIQRDDRRDPSKAITSKPPMITWMTAGTAALFGVLNDVTLYLPGAICTLLVAWLILWIGARYFNPYAGLIGAFAFLMSMAGWKLVHILRPDTVFTFFMFLSVWVCFLCYKGRLPWVVFWLTAALATLSKLPLSPILPLVSLLVFWKRPNAKITTKERFIWVLKHHGPGIVLYLLAILGWFALGYLEQGEAMLEKLIGRELVRHASENADDYEYNKLIEPSLYMLLRFAPWTIIAVWGSFCFYRSKPKGVKKEIYSYLLFFTLSGLLLFSVIQHQRWVHLFPLLPAVSLFAGIELARHMTPKCEKKLLQLFLPVSLLCCLIAYGFFLVYQPWEVQGSVASRQVGKDVTEQVGSEFPMMHLDPSISVQYELGRLRRRVSLEQARESLMSEEAAFVMVRRNQELEDLMFGYVGAYCHVIGWWPYQDGDRGFRLVSNRSELRYYEDMTFYHDDYEMKLHDLEVVKLKHHHFHFKATSDDFKLKVINYGDQEREFTVVIDYGSLTRTETRTLAPEEVANFSFLE